MFFLKIPELNCKKLIYLALKWKIFQYIIFLLKRIFCNNVLIFYIAGALWRRYRQAFRTISIKPNSTTYIWVCVSLRFQNL